MLPQELQERQWSLYDGAARRGSHSRARVSTTARSSRSPIGGPEARRVQSAAEVECARSMYFLPLRVRRAVIEAGQVRDGP